MIPLIDGGCFAGTDPETGLSHPIESLLADFDRYGVARGLVGSYRCLYQDLREGNREAWEWGRRFPARIIPLAILHPAYYGESPRTLLGWLNKELGFRAVGLFSSPAYYPVEWDSPSVRRIGQAAAGLEMTLQAGIRNEAELAGILRAWGDLKTPVMIRWMAGHRYRWLSSEIAAAAASPHLLFDVGNLNSAGGIEFAVKAIGEERLFFASNSPHHLSGPPHSVLHDANLSAEQRELLRHGNITRSLQMKRSPAEGPALLSVYDTKAWENLCLQPKVDIHWHPDHWNLGEPNLSEGDQRTIFDRYGMERIIFSSILALNYDLSAGNAATASWFEKDPRFFGMVVVDPMRLKESLDQIERYVRHPRFVGLKTLQDLLHIGLEDLLYEPLLEKASQHHLPVMAHLPGLDKAAQRHPEITFIAAHANWQRAQRLIDLPNVCFDFATGHALRFETQMGRFIQAVGADRVLFGSDGLLVSPAWSLSKWMEVPSSPEEQDLVFRGNAYRIFSKLRAPVEVR